MKRLFQLLKAELFIFAVAYLPLAFIYSDFNVMDWSSWGRFFIVFWMVVVHALSAIYYLGKKQEEELNKSNKDMREAMEKLINRVKSDPHVN